MAPRKRSRAKKPAETMRQRQMRLRRMQKALKTSKKQLPPGKQGGAIVKSGSSKPMSPRAKAALDKQKRAARGTTGSRRAAGGRGLAKQTPKLPPAGKTARNLLRNRAVAGGAAGKLSGIGLALSGVATAQDLAASLKRGEGLARLPKIAKQALTAKPPKRSSGPTNRRGRSTNRTTSSNKPARRGVSNIPPKEGTGKGSPNDRKPESTTTKKSTATPTKTTPKKTPKKLTGVGPVKSGQGYSTAVTGKTKLQRQAEELRAMQKRSRERQAAQKKKKK